MGFHSALQSNPVLQPNNSPQHNIFQPLRQWLDDLEVHDRKLAHRLAKLIPAQCPFERDIKLFGRTLAHIPPLCKFNPLYDQLVGLRFRALCYLADECGEDIQSYC
jgi:Mo-dependent nitrogenase C-terminus